MRQPAKENTGKVFELETSKFEECKKEPISFDQDSVKTGDIYFCLLSLLKCSHLRGRSGQPLEFCKKANLKNFAILTEKHLCWSLFLIKLQAVCNFIKKRLQHKWLFVNIAKFVRSPILKNICERLLLKGVLVQKYLIFLKIVSYFQEKLDEEVGFNKI